MTDILSAVEKTLAEADMPKKKGKKGKKQNTQQNKNELRKFDDLEAFCNFLKMESPEDYVDNVHVQLSYFPPFVLQHSHNDPEKIKDSMNKNNKKFLRHLHQHVDRHLIKDIQENTFCGEEIKLKNIKNDTTLEKLIWHYVDLNEHSVGDKKFKIEMDVECHSNDANVFVDYRSCLCN